MNRIHCLIVTAALALAALPAMALDLGSARTGGKIGEKRDGYVEARQASGEASRGVVPLPRRWRVPPTRRTRSISVRAGS